MQTDWWSSVAALRRYESVTLAHEPIRADWHDCVFHVASASAKFTLLLAPRAAGRAATVATLLARAPRRITHADRSRPGLHTHAACFYPARKDPSKSHRQCCDQTARVHLPSSLCIYNSSTHADRRPLLLSLVRFRDSVEERSQFAVAELNWTRRPWTRFKYLNHGRCTSPIFTGDGSNSTRIHE